MRSTHVSTSRRSARPRRALGVGLVALCCISVLLQSSPASADPADIARFVLTETNGTVIGRGGSAATVGTTVNNLSPTVVTGVQLRYQLPLGVEFATASSTPGCSVLSTMVTCQLGSMAPGEVRPVVIGVRESDAAAVLGTRTGYFLTPTTDQFDPGAGEVLITEWDHEAGAEGTSLAQCWPLANPTPNMDVAGGVCDGTNDSAPLTPDATTVLGAFPGPVSQFVIRSYQFETEITAPATATYRACGVNIDDGGYIAIAEVGAPLSSAATVLNVTGFSSVSSAPFSLVGGKRYQVVMRISNRGVDGVDNSAGLAGWDGFGIVPSTTACGMASVAAFDSANTEWAQRTGTDVIVAGSSDLSIAGIIESAPTSGIRNSSIRVANTGPDPTDATIEIAIPVADRVTTPVSGCLSVQVAETTRCTIGPLASADSRVISMAFEGPDSDVRWKVNSASAIDLDPANNSIPAG